MRSVRSPVLIGPEGELAELTDLVVGASHGRGGAAFVLGEPGIGSLDCSPLPPTSPRRGASALPGRARRELEVDEERGARFAIRSTLLRVGDRTLIARAAHELATLDVLDAAFRLIRTLPTLPAADLPGQADLDALLATPHTAAG